MNIKKNFKTVILFTSIIINFSLIIGLCVSINSKAKVGDNTPISLIEQSDETSILSNAKRYVVQQDDFCSYYNWNGKLFFAESPYEHFIVNSLNVDVGEMVNTDSTIGSKDGEEVKALAKGTIVNIDSNDDSDFDVTVYYFNQFEVTIDVDLDTYYSIDIKQLDHPQVNFDHGSSLSLTFDKFDYSQVESNSIVTVYFNVEGCDSIISPTTNIKITSIEEDYGEFFYISNSNFSNVQEVRRMKVIEEDNSIDVDIYCLGIYGEYALISCDDYAISQGTILYENNA